MSDAAWADELRAAFTVKAVPEGWITAADIGRQIGISDTTMRRNLDKIDDESLFVDGRRGHRSGRFYDWEKIKEILGL